MTISVVHALDLAFNKGKENILSTWVESVAGDLLKKAKGTKKEKNQIVSDRTMALFDSMPKFTKKKRGK